MGCFQVRGLFKRIYFVGETQFTGSHGTTFGGSPLACAIGHHVLTRLSSPVFRTQMEDVSGYFGERLSKLPKWYPGILEEDIRGRGFIRGLGFKDNAVPGRIVKLARERGVLILTAGGTVRLVPSLTVSKEEVDLAVDVLESCLESLHITV
jgi:acetylornithine aminotransferase